MATVISRYVGDTVPDEFTVVAANGSAIDITGFSFKMAVNTLKAPVDITSQLFVIDGVITDAGSGKVQFAPLPDDVSQDPGSYFFGIRMTDAGGKTQTLDIGTYKFIQSIVKDAILVVGP